MISITGYEHVGIRVTDPPRALAFYRFLGFELDHENSHERVAEIVNAHGVRMSLIFNGEAWPGGNVLLDHDRKWPGCTHPAFIVESLADLMRAFAAAGVALTEGPHDWGRRQACFIRDPDGNVLEFNEMTPLSPEPAA